VAIRRQTFEKLGGFAEDLRYLEDYELPLRLALEGPWAVIREPLVVYGENPPVSFSEEARRNSVLLRECELEVYKRILSRVNGDNRYQNAGRNLERRWSMARR